MSSATSLPLPSDTNITSRENNELIILKMLLMHSDRFHNIINNQVSPPLEYEQRTRNIEVSRKLFDTIKEHIDDFNNLSCLCIEDFDDIREYFDYSEFPPCNDEKDAACCVYSSYDEPCDAIMINLNESNYFEFYNGMNKSNNTILLRLQREFLLLYNPSNEYQSFVINDTGYLGEIYQIVFLDDGKHFDCYAQSKGEAYKSRHGGESILEQSNYIRHLKVRLRHT